LPNADCYEECDDERCKQFEDKVTGKARRQLIVFHWNDGLSLVRIAFAADCSIRVVKELLKSAGYMPRYKTCSKPPRRYVRGPYKTKRRRRRQT
jgi:hypothetical protein